MKNKNEMTEEEMLEIDFTKWFFIFIIVILTFAAGINLYKINAKKEVVKVCLKNGHEPNTCYKLVKNMGLTTEKSHVKKSTSSSK